MSCFSISHVYQSALSLSTALHPLPTQLHPVIKEPMGTRKLIVCPGISAPCCRADLLTPVPLPSAHHSSSLSPLQHTLDECNSYESGSVLLTRLIRPQAVLSLRCHKPLVKHVVVGWTPVAFQWVPANDELIWLIIYYVLSRICICYQVHVLMHEDVTQPTSSFHSGFHADKMLM